MKQGRDVDDVGGVEVMAELFSLFGTRRAVELIGWVVVWGVTGQINDLNSLREDMEARGLSKATAYRALVDFRKLREYLERKCDRVFSVAEVLATVKAAASQK
jgi:hypothetical protein